jgi:hypothetical protein
VKNPPLNQPRVVKSTGMKQRETDRLADVQQALHRIGTAPTLFRFNGCGTKLLGFHADPLLIHREAGPTHFSRLFFTLFFIPVVGLDVYLIRYQAGGLIQFLGRMSAANFHRIYRGELDGFYYRAVIRGLGIAAVVIVLLLLIGGLADLLGAHRMFIRFRL